ncbi:hypothetical protein DN31_1045 [Vibrio mimicus]|nr:hypothetical protein DN31_1045 [Vibrio mimicus]
MVTEYQAAKEVLDSMEQGTQGIYEPEKNM